MFVLQVCPQRATACLSQDVDRICKPPCSNRPNYSWNREIIKEVSPRTIRLGWLLLWTRPVGKGVEKTDWFVAIYDQHSLFRPPPSVSLPLSLSLLLPLSYLSLSLLLSGWTPRSIRLLVWLASIYQGTGETCSRQELLEICLEQYYTLVLTRAPCNFALQLSCIEEEGDRPSLWNAEFWYYGFTVKHSVSSVWWIVMENCEKFPWKFNSVYREMNANKLDVVGALCSVWISRNGYRINFQFIL